MKAPKGYVCLVNHALAESEVGVRQIGQSLQQDLRGHSSLEVGWVELVTARGGNSVNKRSLKAMCWAHETNFTV